MKKAYLFFSIFIMIALACDLSASVVPSTSTVPVPVDTTIIPATVIATEIQPVTPTLTTETPTDTPTAPLSPFDGAPVFFGPLSLVLPSGLASGISGSQFPRADGPDLPYWELTPGHTVVKLEGYLLQGKFIQPQIYIYPATGYAELFPGAFESMHRLRNVMNDPGISVNVEQFPAVPFFNAAQVFASNFQLVSFQNGQGVRFITEYAQYAAPVNNGELFYHFQGFTHDGEAYIVAIFPITVPVLAETSDPGAMLPSEGIPYPDINDPNADWQGYYAAITNLLNATSPDAFAPTISQLDLLIQSMQITP